MADARNAPPTGFVATCRCGVVVGAMDYIRSDRREAGRLLGQWLHNGCTIEPRFTGAWNVSIEPCRCIRGGTEMVTPPAEGEVGELVAWLRSLVHCSISFKSGSENTHRLVRAAYLLLDQSHQIAELQRQLNRRTHLNG